MTADQLVDALRQRLPAVRGNVPSVRVEIFADDVEACSEGARVKYRIGLPEFFDLDDAPLVSGELIINAEMIASDADADRLRDVLEGALEAEMMNIFSDAYTRPDDY